MDIQQKINEAIALMDMNGRFNSAGNATMLENGQFDTVRSALAQANTTIERLRAELEAEQARTICAMCGEELTRMAKE